MGQPSPEAAKWIDTSDFRDDSYCMRRRGVIAGLGAALAVISFAVKTRADRLEDILSLPLDHPAVQYMERTNADPVARLDQRLENGQAKLDFALNSWGYLPAVLKQLGMNADSQVLVFSKTSIQNSHISPRTPRAIYFNDDVAVGYVQNGDELELSALDPVRGVIFYTLEMAKSDQVGFARRDDCLRCHLGPVTLGAPGLLISSIHPRTRELRDVHGSAFMTDHRSSFGERWGGWYVTGTHGSARHLGNNIALVDPVESGEPAGDASQNITNLGKMLDTSKYLVPTSDIVALMTLEHQIRMTNLLTRIGWDARIALHDASSGEAQDTVVEKLRPEIDEMVGYMLFLDEAPLEAPVKGVSSFTTTFPQRGPRDRSGRSLRDFDLRTRLFRYPLSYMIYSPAFDGLPAPVHDYVYQRLYNVFTSAEQSPKYARLSAEDRRALLEIVQQTKPGLPAYWKPNLSPTSDRAFASSFGDNLPWIREGPQCTECAQRRESRHAPAPRFCRDYWTVAVRFSL